MPSPVDLEPLRIFGHAIGIASTPGMAFLSAFALGWLLGAIPVGAAEVLVLLLAAVRPTSLVVPLLLVMTAGHILGKLGWYWLGTQHERLPDGWLRRQVRAAQAFVRANPGLGAITLASSAMVSVPPFHLTSIGAGIVHASVWRFALVAFVGRAVRFGVIALVPQVVPWLVR